MRELTRHPGKMQVAYCAIGLTFSAAAMAGPRALDEADLDRVWAGGLGTPASQTATVSPAASDSQRNDRGQTGPDAGSGSTQASSEDRTSPRPTGRDAVVARDGRLDLNTEAAIRLEGGAQQRIRAANVSNAAAADVVNAANVFSGAAAGPLSWSLGLVQENILTQTEQVGARLERLSIIGADVVRDDATSFSRQDGFQRSVVDSVRDATSFRSVETLASDVEIPSFRPLTDLTIRPEVGTPEVFELPGFSFDLKTTIGVGDLSGTFGVGADVGPTELGVPQVVFGELRLDGDDVVIAPGSFTLPQISLPDVSGEICFVDCASGTVRFDTVEATTLTLPIPETRFEGGNPFQDFDIQIGQGIAATGSGSFSFGGPRATVSANLSLSLPGLRDESLELRLFPNLDFLDRSIPIPGVSVSDVLSSLGDSTTVTIDLPDISLPDLSFDITLLDFASDPIALDFGFSGSMEDAVLCIAIISTDCGTQSFFKDEVFVRDDSRMTMAEESRSFSEAYSERREVQRRVGAELRDAEAELIAMSGARADVEHYSVVFVSDATQIGLRALNAANVTTAMVGNSANVFRTPSQRPGSGAPAAANLSQTNVFVQGFR